ncbi:MAG TPA: hypothetical protein VMS77_01150 [Conexivisphaerales archaeon]|nr:hypothetical protein [Conexivisphaerales archaeon]
MKRRHAAFCIALLLLALPAIPSYPADRGPSVQAQSGEVSLTPSTNSTAVGLTVSFSGAVSGVNVSSVTYYILGPDGTSDNATIPLAGSDFSFNYTFPVAGDWTVFCIAGDQANPQAISDPAIISVASASGPTYLGIPVVWLGVGILLVSAASLLYLVYAIRKRSEEEERAAGAKEAAA